MASQPLDLVSDPVRLAIVRALAKARSADLAELAETTGVHVNTARAHVGVLERAGALERSSVPGPGRGRPRIAYRLAGGWRPPSDGPPDEGRLLTKTLSAMGFTVDAGERVIGLSNCPCSRIRPDAPEVICALADAVAEGVLSGSGSGRRVAETRHDPLRHRCAVVLGP